MLDWLLQHQFLRDEVNDVVYQMTEGSGQGMAASGEVASTTFLYDVEKHSALVPILEESFQLKFYGRYVDNIFLVCPKFGAGSILSRMRSLAKSTWN